MKTLKTIYGILYRSFGPQDWWPADTPFEVAVGAVLTQNTNWGNVERAIRNLKAHKALSVRAIHKMTATRLAELIKPAGYFNVKARRLKALVNFVVSEYGGSLKKMSKEDDAVLREKLLRVHGIGPETADSILLYALNKPVFVIDAYTKRVLSRHGLINPGDSYHACQELFHSHLKKDVLLFNEYHALLVKAAKEHCRTKPLCETCPIKGI